MLADDLHHLVESQSPVDLNRLGEHLPYEWIEHAVRASGVASIRRRRLPAQQVVWLVIALALYRHQSISEVVDELDLALPARNASFVSKSAVAQARQRTGAAPLAWLFHESARNWVAQDQAQFLFKGLSLFAMDGTTLRAADSAANRKHFGAQVCAHDRVGSYPQIRAVTLTAIPTHLVRDIEFGPYCINEMISARELIPRVPANSLTVFDRGFLSAQLLCNLVSGGENRHFIIPAKSNTRWDVVAGKPGDQTVRMRVSQQARKKCPELPEFWEARAVLSIDARGRQRVLLSSLVDRRRFKAADIVSCYQRRWQIETSYHELKQSMLGMELTFRSQTVEGIYQEVWGTLIAYNLIRLEIAKAALQAQRAPEDLSFIRAFHPIQYELTWAAATRSYGKLPALLTRLRERLKQLSNEKRPGRSCARAVKSRPFRYTVRYLKRDLN
ncbi:IS4 family transposase [Caballeronia sp. SEWSISQ10-4 2]|uniref:IS4 family transposase n=1 Tax=Caballeronia sp. SEWSISQ10-4 2 TaxID=2937438 RepID=UPI00264C1021|nr:IS4 family transposase [Caballeronia sp. SEWSISQ10-4 2]MDN7184766.1 IS4 family transposase [Caballeronia sp. SEWSISQ10-4 2]